MPSDTRRGFIEVFDDFDADFVHTSAANGVRWLISSDASDTAFTPATVLGGCDVAQGSVTTTDNNLIELAHGALMWRAQDGQMIMEARISVDGATTFAANVGFNDDQLDDSNTLPVELSTTTFTANAAEYIGFVFDTDATNDDLHVCWIDDSAVPSTGIANLRITGLAPIGTNTNFYTYRVEVFDNGSGNQCRAVFHVTTHQGISYEKTFAATIDRDALLTPYVGLEQRDTTAARQMNVDYIYACKSRGG